MPTSQTGFLAEILSGGSLPVTGEPIPAGQRAYFQERLRGRIFSFIVGEFLRQQRENPDITQAAIARRLERRPEQINRWLSGPSNMTIDTISDLVLSVWGGEPSMAIATLRQAKERRSDGARAQAEAPAAASQAGGMTMYFEGGAGAQAAGATAGASSAAITAGAQAIADLPTQTTSSLAKWDDLTSANIANSNSPQSAQPNVLNQARRG